MGKQEQKIIYQMIKELAEGKIKSNLQAFQQELKKEQVYLQKSVQL